MTTKNDYANVIGFANNILMRANAQDQAFKRWCQEIGQVYDSTWYMDLSIAEMFDKADIRKTVEDGIQNWKQSPKMVGQLMLAVGTKAAQHHSSNPDLCEFYSDLYHEKLDEVYEMYKDDEPAQWTIFRYTD